MNRRKAKVLSRAAALLAGKKSRLTWDGRGTRVYPRDSIRATYQRLKKEARDPARYAELQAIVEDHDRKARSARAAGSVLQPLGPQTGTMTGGISSETPNLSNGPREL